jgi:hypothetical protein
LKTAEILEILDAALVLNASAAEGIGLDVLYWLEQQSALLSRVTRKHLGRGSATRPRLREALREVRLLLTAGGVNGLQKWDRLHTWYLDSYRCDQ